MGVIRTIRPETVTLVDIDDVCENGIAFSPETVPKVIKKFREKDIDALFIPFCDFGEEQETKGPTLLRQGEETRSAVCLRQPR